MDLMRQTFDWTIALALESADWRDGENEYGALWLCVPDTPQRQGIGQ